MVITSGRYEFNRYFKEIAEFDGKTTQANILRSLHQFNQNNQTIFSQVFMIRIFWGPSLK